MRWLKPSIRNSIYGLLGHPSEPTASTMDSGIEDIREAMLDLLDGHSTRQAPHLVRRIRYAGDIQALWYLRGDLMALLAAMHGEAEARLLIERISRMFRGLLPSGLNSRPSPLVG